MGFLLGMILLIAAFVMGANCLAGKWQHDDWKKRNHYTLLFTELQQLQKEDVIQKETDLNMLATRLSSVL